MGDIYLGFCISALLSLVVFVFFARIIIKIRLKKSLLVALLLCILLIAYINQNNQIFSDVYFYTEHVALTFDFFVIVVSCFIGCVYGFLAQSKIRKFAYSILLFTLASYYSYSALFSESVKCRDKRKGNVHLQTRNFTCSAASAATLLSIHGIESKESEMAKLCFTSSDGTMGKWLMRGLKIR